MKHDVMPGHRPLSRRLATSAVLGLMALAIVVLMFPRGSSDPTVVVAFNDAGETLTLSEFAAEPFCLTSNGRVGVILKSTTYPPTTNDELHVYHGVDAWTAADREPVGYVAEDAVPKVNSGSLPTCEGRVVFGPPPSR